jgi:hypothetical protein
LPSYSNCSSARTCLAEHFPRSLLDVPWASEHWLLVYKNCSDFLGIFVELLAKEIEELKAISIG